MVLLLSHVQQNPKSLTYQLVRIMGSISGERFSRFCFGSKTAIASLSVEAGTNGVRRVELQGYQSDANQALGTVTEAAVRAAVAR